MQLSETVSHSSARPPCLLSADGEKSNPLIICHVDFCSSSDIFPLNLNVSLHQFASTQANLHPLILHVNSAAVSSGKNLFSICKNCSITSRGQQKTLTCHHQWSPVAFYTISRYAATWSFIWRLNVTPVFTPHPLRETQSRELSDGETSRQVQLQMNHEIIAWSLLDLPAQSWFGLFRDKHCLLKFQEIYWFY